MDVDARASLHWRSRIRATKASGAYRRPFNSGCPQSTSVNVEFEPFFIPSGQPASIPMDRWLHPISKRRARFSASHATLDRDRACSAAQDGTLSLSKAATRLTQMMKAGDTFL